MAKETSDLLNRFNTDRKSMAKSSAKDRADFMINMSNTVAAFINEASQDRAGAHAAFFGATVLKKKSDTSRIAIQVIDEPIVEMPKSVPPSPEAPMIEGVAQSAQTSASENSSKIETFSESDSKSAEPKKPRKKHGEQFAK
jgi:hypothetical protein